jgi:hypothetical protein
VYACRICPYDEEADNKCVYRNDLLTVTQCVFPSSCLLVDVTDVGSSREQRGVTNGVGTDLTLVHIHCRPRCDA